MAEINTTELESVIRDNVRTAIAGAMVDAVRQAKETAEAQKADPAAQVVAGARGPTHAPEAHRANVDRGSLEVIHDPHKGKGLAFARMVKAQAAGVIERRDPVDVAHGWSRDFPHYREIAERLEAHKRAMNEGTFAQGGSLVPQAYGEFIELLYAATTALAMGARVVDFNGSLNMGKLNSGASVYYVGEAENVTPSTPGTGEVRLSRKKAAAVVAITNEMLRNPAVGADTLVRDDLVQQMALRRDLSFFRGTGSQNQPKGIANWIASGQKFNQAGTTTANKISDLVKLIRLVDESNVPLSSAGYIMAPRTLWGLASTVDSNSNLVFANMLSQGMLFGFKVMRSTQIPTNLGSSESEIYFGAFNDAIMGFDTSTPLAVEVFPNGTFWDGSALVSGISSDQSVIRVLEGHDVALRHDNTFALHQQTTWA